MPPKAKPTGPPVPLLTLHAADHENASATMPISWCAHDGLAEHLLENDFIDPRILLVVQSVGGDRFAGVTDEVWRDTGYYLVPLKQGFAPNVVFRRPGRNRVTAVLVDTGRERSRKALKRVVRSEPGLYVNVIGFRRFKTVPDKPYLRAGYTPIDRIVFSPEVVTTIEVDVDPELFAKPVAPWRKWVAARVFGSAKFRDECDVRRRMLAGLALLPFILLAANVAKFASIPVMWLFGARRPPYEQLARPHGKFFTDFVDDPRADYSSFWWRKRKTQHEKDYGLDASWRFDEPFNLVNVCLSPPVLLLLPLAVFAIFQYHHGVTHKVNGHAVTTHPKLNDMSLLHTYAWVDGSLVALFIGLAAFIAASSGVAWLCVTTYEFITGVDLSRKPKVLTPSEEAIRRAVLLASCSDDGPRTSLRDLSLSQWTPRLVYNSAKAAVCRPFAQ